jgi:hypothetical protein
VLSGWLVALRLMDDEDAPIRELAAGAAGAAMDAASGAAAAEATGELQEQQVLQAAFAFLTVHFGDEAEWARWETPPSNNSPCTTQLSP